MVIGAVILDFNNIPTGIRDSKKLTSKKRRVLSDMIKETAIAYSIVCKDNKFIDDHGVGYATRQAMCEAVEALSVKPDYVLIDAIKIAKLTTPHRSIIRGDDLSVSIGAASIIAKVYRDQLLTTLGEQYPQYKFEKHFGYPTKEHIEALKAFGLTPYHRRTYKPCRMILRETQTNAASCFFV